VSGQGAAPTYRLHVTTHGGQVYAVGPRGLDYYDVFTGYGRLVTNEQHAGRLPAVKSISIVPDTAANAAPEAPPEMLVPGTVFQGTAAAEAIAARLGMAADTEPARIGVVERMIEHGVLGPLPDQPGVFVLLAVPQPRHREPPPRR
jgi:hypothetical protein